MSFRSLLATSGIRSLPIHVRLYELARMVRVSFILSMRGRHG